ncbi:V-type ATP synthase subunit E [Halothermothrix orenii]|uniref:V-type proton ATPase subunit E n=1 Tax=Halothermothrix orenii (strain H 168 / OCM 544 / DSM 9562) TaxID=373903 RepID=VATE_HALOH|nr:V-type ATP synthase subunit E family protein [Halothermothrix orenii]B8CZG9.1 RecName: Full=V-type proton ATPase subunit E; AltName: Full=V-ATPase subunit E [Halothermothrix orenii H 168]ACL70688.1 V-type ATP synthase subunit E [Halothermothrix orenii H 168]
MDVSKKISVIKKEIINEALDKKEQIISREKDKWEKEYEDFKQKLDNKEKEIIELYRQEARMKKEQIVSRAVLKKKTEKRQKMDEYLHQILKELEEKLHEYRNDTGYRDFLKRLVKDSLNVMESSHVIIKLNSHDLKIFNEIQDELRNEIDNIEIEVANNPLNISGGVIVEDRDGKEIVENTFETCLEEVKEDIAVELHSKVL